MSVSTIVTLGFGSYGVVNFIPTLGYGDYGVSPASDIPMGGSGHPSVYWQGKRKKRTLQQQPEKHLRHILDRVVAEYYGEIVDADVPASVKAEAGKLVKPYADKKGRFKSVPTVEQIDWNAVQQNADAVGAILRIWSDEIERRARDDDDDEAILLLMS